MPPGSLRKDVLHQLHEGHCGYGKTLQTARDLYYWPSMKHDIRIMIDKCKACQQLRPSKPVEPLITTSASFPMEQLSVDLFHVRGKTYMVTADRYSGYIWIDMLRDQGTKAVTDILDKITRIFGVPLKCRTDGGPQFRGPFDEDCRKKGITPETLPPYNPRSNRHAEAPVKAAKHLLLKTTPAEFPSTLAAWRNMVKEDKPSPNELIFCRKVRDGKAIFTSHLEVKNNQQSKPGKNNQHILEGAEIRARGTRQHQPHQRIPEQFRQGDSVRVQDPHTKRWDVQAVITGFSQTGRTLELCTDEGHLMQRNRRFVRRQCAA